MSPAKPRPEPDPLSAAYWEGARERRLLIRRCQRCGTYQHPPAPFCRACGDERLVAEQVSGGGTIRSFVVLEETPVPGFEAQTPFTVAAVELDEQPDLVISAIVTGPGREEIAIGDRSMMAWEELGDGTVLPQLALEKAE